MRVFQKTNWNNTLREKLIKVKQIPIEKLRKKGLTVNKADKGTDLTNEPHPGLRRKTKRNKRKKS